MVEDWKKFIDVLHDLLYVTDTTTPAREGIIPDNVLLQALGTH